MVGQGIIHMQGLLRLSRMIDRLLHWCAAAGAWCGVFLICVVCYDVVTRYLGVPKLFGWTSTMLQESEYWLHSFLIVLVVGYAYHRQAHVRIDLVRETLSTRTKFWLEAVGIALFLIPYAVLGAWLAWPYVVQSFLSGEISKSQTGLSHIWILKSGMIALYVLLLLAGISQLIKAVAGIRGELPDELVAETIGNQN